MSCRAAMHGDLKKLEEQKPWKFTIGKSEVLHSDALTPCNSLDSELPY